MSDEGASTADRDQRIAALEAELALVRAELVSRDLLIQTLRVEIARLRRMQFGTSSEKLAQLELTLEELEVEEAIAEAGKAERPAPIRSLPVHLPREEVVHEPAGGSCTCAGSARMLTSSSISCRCARDPQPASQVQLPLVRADRLGARAGEADRAGPGDVRYTGAYCRRHP